jgi:GxxExxY protein
MELLHKSLTDKIIRAYFKVYNTLGYGFLEKVYENALFIELRRAGLKVSKQQPIRVYYEGEIAGEYFADLIVENLVIIEVKAAEKIVTEHQYQLQNYLKATSVEVGLLLNFGKEPEYARKVFTKEHKRWDEQ